MLPIVSNASYMRRLYLLVIRPLESAFAKPKGPSPNSFTSRFHTNKPAKLTRDAQRERPATNRINSSSTQK